MLRKHIFKDKPRIDSVRWRLHEPTRLEAFSDAVIAFAVTLVVVSLEVPKTFDALNIMMKGFYAFAICFLFLVLIWHDQYIFFRRYGLQDTYTTMLNFALLFMVVYLVYPLKFLFTALTQGNEAVLENGKTIVKFSSDSEVSQLMIIYGIGYFVIYTLMLLMYCHALKRKKDIHLTPLEVYNTKTFIYSFAGRICVVLLSLALAVYGLSHGGGFAFLSGISYSLMGIEIAIVHSRRKKKIPVLFTREEMDELKNDVIIIEEKT